jgi:hypothetical protein
MEIIENSSKKRLKQLKTIFGDMKKTFNKDLDKFDIHLNNFIMNARTITFLLQKEFKRTNQFDKWYKNKREEMKQRGFDNFVDMRNKIEKEGNLRNTSVLHITVKNKDESGSKLLTAEIDEKGNFKNEIYGGFETKPFFGGMDKLNFRKLDETMFKQIEEYLSYLDKLVKEAYEKFNQLI